MAAGTEARNQAKLVDGFYGNIFSTTSGDREDRDGDYAYRIMDNATVWSERFYDCQNRSALYRMVKVNRNSNEEFKNSLLINGTFSYRQLGRSKNWLLDSIANSRGDRDQIKRDYLNIWTTGSSYSPLDHKINDIIANSEVEANYVEVVENKYLLRWYCDEKNRDEYLNEECFVLGLDCSEAIGNDAVGIVLSDVRDMRTAMSTNITEANLLTFAHWLAELLIKYKTITLIPEMASTARVIIDVLLIELPLAGIDPYTRIFNNLIDKPEKFREIEREMRKPIGKRGSDFIDKHRKEIGYITTKESREFLFKNNLQLAASRAGHVVLDTVLSKEIRGLVVKNGRVDHKASGHDDVCVAWLLNHWFLTNARNLEKYGIRRGLPLSMVTEHSDTVNVIDEMELKEQSLLREKIDKLVETLSKTESLVHIAKIKNDIRNLSKGIKETDSTIYNFDSLLKRAEDLKSKRQKEERMKRRKYSFNRRRY